MAGDSPLPALLERASNVFFCAGDLGRAFQEERQSRGSYGVADPGSWARHKPAFDAFCSALSELRQEIQKPPSDFAPVAKVLMEAAAIAKGIRDAMKGPDGHQWSSHLDCFPDLNSVSEKGYRTIKAARAAMPVDDPLTFVAEKVAAEDPASALELMAQRRAEAKNAAADRGWQNMQLRDKLEVAWDRIYVFSPTMGEPEDYPRWVENLMHFAAVARETGFADPFRVVRIGDKEGGKALSLIQAALTGDRKAVRSRLMELDAKGDDRGWKEVFRHSAVFWMVMQPENRFITATAAPNPSNSGRPIPPAWQEARERIDSTPVVPRPPDRLVEAAMRDVPELVVDGGPNGQGHFERGADALGHLLKKKGHNLAAAHWAIHRLILDGKLSTDIREVGLPNVFYPNGSTAFPETGIFAIPSSGATPFEAFVVRATEALWEWWRDVQDAGNESNSSIDGPHIPQARPVQGTVTNVAGRGRPKADFETEQLEASLAVQWERAKASGVFQPDFARDNNMTAKELKRLLDRVAKRAKRRSDK